MMEKEIRYRDGGTSVTDGGVANCGADEEPPTACAHTFNMTDSFGDGWNGAAADILVNGKLLSKDATITQEHQELKLLHAATGDTIELEWTSGSFASEVSWTIMMEKEMLLRAVELQILMVALLVVALKSHQDVLIHLIWPTRGAMDGMDSC